jgi:hypothetical protein
MPRAPTMKYVLIFITLQYVASPTDMTEILVTRFNQRLYFLDSINVFAYSN